MQTVSGETVALAGAPLGMTLVVIGQGVRMPAYQVAEVEQAKGAAFGFQPLQSARPSSSPTASKGVYVAPVYARKQDRN